MTCHLYRVYGSQGDLLYLGITGDLDRRFTGHRGTSDWWPLMRKCIVRTYACRDAAIAVEARAIRLLAPRHNVEGMPDGYRPPAFSDQEMVEMIQDINQSTEGWKGRRGPAASVAFEFQSQEGE